MFKNTALLGSFGEYCYQDYAQKMGFIVEKESILESDFLLNYNKKIDVKTTLSKKKRYYGRRLSSDICYDLVSIQENIIYLFPDKHSPLQTGKVIILGLVDVLYPAWIKTRGHLNLRSQSNNVVRKYRKTIKNSIIQMHYFKNKKLRVLFRGSVTDRWKTGPDNLPGSEDFYKKFDFTVFVQMKTKNNNEEISKIYVFETRTINNLKIIPADKRQESKGIKGTLDLEWYENMYSSWVFQKIQDIKI